MVHMAMMCFDSVYIHSAVNSPSKSRIRIAMPDTALAIQWVQSFLLYLCSYYAIAYTDDIVLLAPSASAMRAMLSVCDQFGSQYSVKFNATKFKSMQFAARGRVKRHLASRPDFCISGHSI